MQWIWFPISAPYQRWRGWVLMPSNLISPSKPFARLHFTLSGHSRTYVCAHLVVKSEAKDKKLITTIKAAPQNHAPSPPLLEAGR